FAILSSMSACVIVGFMGSCRDATQIVVDIRTDIELCTKIKRTGVAVTTPDQIDTAPLEIFEGPGCEQPADRIGTLTITASGCKGQCTGTKCVVNCAVADCKNGATPCTYGLDCEYNCNSGECAGAKCATDGGCTINCKQGNACTGITCSANTCNVECQAQDSC